jgi:hypothetical protein
VRSGTHPLIELTCRCIHGSSRFQVAILICHSAVPVEITVDGHHINRFCSVLDGLYRSLYIDKLSDESTELARTKESEEEQDQATHLARQDGFGPRRN